MLSCARRELCETKRGLVVLLPPQRVLLARESHVHQRRILLAPLTGRRFSHAVGQGVLHHARCVMIKAEQVAQLVFENGEQILAILLALVAGRSESIPSPALHRRTNPSPAFIQSSFRIVPMPRFLVNSELPLLPNRSK